MFAMGIGMVYTQHHTRKKAYVHRGIKIGIVGRWAAWKGKMPFV